MAARRYLYLYMCTVVILTVTIKAQSTTNSPQSQQGNYVSDSTSDEKSSLEKGVDVLYSDIMHGFLDAVVPGRFFSNEDPGAITYQDLNRIMKNGTYSELQDRWQDLVKEFGGFMACVIIGLLFIVCMPFFGLIWCCSFCCCKCCGKAKNKEDPKHAQCQRFVFGLLLFAFATFMLVGGIVAIISNEILHEKFRNEDNKGPVGMIQGSVNTLEDFAKDTIKDIDRTASQTLDTTVAGVVTRIKDATNTTVDEIAKSINAEQLLTDAESLGRDASAVLTDLNNVSTTLGVINDLNTQISDTLTSVKSSVTTACTGAPAGVTCPDVSGLDTDTDFTGIQSVQNEITEMQKAQGIINQTKMARQEFTDMQAEVNAKIQTEINHAVTQADTITRDVSSELKVVNQTIQPFIDSVEDNVKPQLQDLDSYLKKYGDYGWYGGIVIPCVLILTVLFYYFGLLFGTFGDRPGDGAQCCNKGAASNFLVCGVVWSFLFASILMIIVLVLFLVGGGMYTVMCRDLNKGVENIQLYEPVVEEVLNIKISKLLYENNAPENLTLGGILADCKANKALYTAVQLKHKFDLDTLLNASKVTEEINKVMQKEVTVNSIDIIPADLQAELNKFANSGVDMINFTEYTSQLSRQVTTQPLDTAITDLNTAANALENAGGNASANSLRNQATILTTLKDTEVRNMTSQFDQLRAIVDHLQTYADLKNRTTQLIADLTASQNNFNNDSATIVRTTLDNVAGNISNFVQDEIAGIKTKIETDIGNCRPIYTATQRVSDAFCLVALDPFNGFWFGIGWGLSAFIFCIVFALCLASIYQRQLPYDDIDAMRRKQAKRNANQELESPDLEMYQGQGYNAYNQQADHVPLTSMEEGNRKAKKNTGIPNAGYDNDGRQQDRYLRNGEGGYDYGLNDRPPAYHESGQYPPAHGGYPVLPQKQN